MEVTTISEYRSQRLPRILNDVCDFCQKKWLLHYDTNGNLPLLWAKNYPDSMLRSCIWRLKSRLAVIPLLDAKQSWANMVFLNRMTRLAHYVDKKSFFRILPAHYIVIIQPPNKHPIRRRINNFLIVVTLQLTYILIVRVCSLYVKLELLHTSNLFDYEVLCVSTL